MKQQISPAIAAGVIVGLIAIVIGYFFYRGQQSAGEAANIARKGQQAGQRMREQLSASGGSGGAYAPGQQAGRSMMQQMGQSNN